MRPIIEVREISKMYQIGSKSERYLSLRDRLSNPKTWFSRPRTESFYALRDISFDIYPGESVGIIGKNGAGKSTLLKILSRITPPTTGNIKLRGRVASLLEVGTGFHPELTGRENIYFNGAILGMKKSEIQSKFDEIVDFSCVEQFLDTPLKQYSSGMQLRLAFAVAAHLDPEILLIDEVLSVGDAAFQKKCLGKMEEVSRQQGKTVVVVSHDLSTLAMVCSTGIVLDHGLLVNMSSISTALTHYEDILQNGKSVFTRHDSDKSAFIQSVRISIVGRQPNLLLEIKIAIYVKQKAPLSYVAFYVGTATMVPILESIPTYAPFIDLSTPGSSDYQFNLHLPALIPGTYRLNIWLGSSHHQTVDWIRDELTFEIRENPIVDRIHPFPQHAGFMTSKSFQV